MVMGMSEGDLIMTESRGGSGEPTCTAEGSARSVHRVGHEWPPSPAHRLLVLAPIVATLADVIERIPPDWRTVLAAPLAQPWFAELGAFVVQQRAEHPVYPPAADVFAALCCYSNSRDTNDTCRRQIDLAAAWPAVRRPIRAPQSQNA